MGLQGFERRLERLVEGTFSKAFRSGIQPVEIGHRITRVVDDGRTVGVGGRIVAPNNIGVYLAPDDFQRFQAFADVLARELAEAARQHARDEGYHFLGPVTVSIVADDSMRVGDLDVVAEIAEGEGGRVGALLLSDGRRVPLGDEALTIGRLAECEIPLSDPRASRRHAQIRPSGEGYVLADLGSMNGTLVNGVAVHEHLLQDGDAISVGSTVLHFEAS